MRAAFFVLGADWPAEMESVADLRALATSSAGSSDFDSNSSVTGVSALKVFAADHVCPATIADRVVLAYEKIEVCWQEKLDDDGRALLLKEVFQYRVKNGTSFDAAFVNRRWRRWIMALFIATGVYGYTAM